MEPAAAAWTTLMTMNTGQSVSWGVRVGFGMENHASTDVLVYNCPTSVNHYNKQGSANVVLNQKS